MVKSIALLALVALLSVSVSLAFDVNSDWSVSSPSSDSHTYGATVGDFDQDGHDDFVYTSYVYVNIKYSNYKSGGSGFTDVRCSIMTSHYRSYIPYRFHVALMDSDDYPDVLFMDYSDINVGYMRNPSGSRQGWSFYSITTESGLSDLVIMNVDNLLRPDFVVGDKSHHRFYVYKSVSATTGINSNVKVITAQYDSSYGSMHSLSSIFFDDDSFEDVVAATTTGIYIFQNEHGTGGNFKMDVPLAAFNFGQSVYKLDIADVNGDGVDDIVFAGITYGFIPMYGLGLHGDPIHFTEGPTFNHQFTDVEAFDIDSDGDLDILVFAYGSPSSSPQIHLYINEGGYPEPAFTHLTSIPGFTPNGSPLDGLTFGDFDNDGDWDLVMTQYTPSKLNVLLNPINIPVPPVAQYGTYALPIYRDSNDGDSRCPVNTFGDDCVCTTTTRGDTTEDMALLAGTTRVQGGNLVISFTEPRKYRYSSAIRPEIHFQDKDGNVDEDQFSKCDIHFSWVVSEDDSSCDGLRTWTGTAPITSVFNGADGCVHETPETTTLDDVPVDIASLYFTVTNGEYVETIDGDSDDQTGTGTGEYILRVVEHALPFKIAFQKQIDVEVSNIEVYSEVVTAKATVAQVIGTVDISGTATAFVDVDLYTRVQHPFQLAYKSFSQATTSFTLSNTESVIDVGYTCDDVDNSDCERQFRVRITDNVDACNFDGSYTVVFDVLCNPDGRSDCPLAGGETVSVTFVLDTNSHCADTVLQTVDVQGELTSYDSDSRDTVYSEFIDEDIMYFQAELFSAETGLRSAVLRTVSINGGSLSTALPIYDVSGVPTSDSKWTFGFNNVENVNTDPTDTVNSRLKPTFEFKALDTELLVATRSTDSFTVTAVFDVVYTAVLASGTSELRTQRVERVFRPSDITSSASSTSTSVRVGRTSSSESDSGLDVASGSNVILYGVCAVSLIAVMAALFAVRRSRKSASDPVVEVDVQQV